MSWNEIQELASQLKAIQQDTKINSLSERTWIDIIRHLISSNRLFLIHSIDGRSFLTRSELDKEILEEVENHSGRISISEIASNIDVDYDIVESRVTALVNSYAQTKGPRKLYGIPTEVVNDVYVRSVAQQIFDKLEESGQVTIAELTTMFNLPSAFVANIMQEYEGTLFRIQKYNNNYVTDAFISATRSKLRGYFTAVTYPVVINSVSQKLQIAENLICSILSSLISSGRISGQLINAKSTFVPTCYTNAEYSYIKSYFDQNGYIEWDYLKRFGIGDPGSYMRLKFRDAVHVAGVSVNLVVIDQLKDFISDAVKDSNWIDVTHVIPCGLDEKERKALLAPLMKDLPLQTVDYIFIISDGFVQMCELHINDYINEKVKEVFEENKLSNLLAPTVFKTVDNDTVTKRNTVQNKGGFGFGAREIKMKSVKKKNNATKKQNSNTDVENAKSLFECSIFKDDLIAFLSSKLSKEVPSEVVDGVVDILYSSLENTFNKTLKRLSNPISNPCGKKDNKYQSSQLINEMLLSIQLLDRGIQLIADESLKRQLSRHLMKSHCSKVIESIFAYVAQEYGFSWPDSSHKTQQNDVVQNSSNQETVALNCNNSDSTTLNSFYSLIDLLRHSQLPNASGICKMLQEIVCNLSSTAVSNLESFYKDVENLAVNELGFNLPTMSNHKDNKRDNAERSKANELAIQIEIQLQNALEEMNSPDNFTKSITTAALAAACILVQVLVGWPITAPGKAVPELILWISQTMNKLNNSSDVNPTNKAIITLANSNVLEDLKMLINHISNKTPSTDYDASSLIKNIIGVTSKCRKQLYS